MNHAAADAEAFGDGRLLQTFIEQMLEQHESVPSEHDVKLRRRDVECEEHRCSARLCRAASLNGCSPSAQCSPAFLSKITPVLIRRTLGSHADVSVAECERADWAEPWAKSWVKTS